jgi:hypothetical protein
MHSDLAGGSFGAHRRLVTAATLAALVTAAGAFAMATRHATPHRVKAFTIRGDLRVPLAPGVSRPLNLVLTNRHHFTLAVTRLSIRLAVDRRHALAGCSASRNFSVRQLPRRAYPLRLPARSARTLLAVGAKRLPRIAMRNRATVDQDRCKGASLRLRYRGTARRARRASR